MVRVPQIVSASLAGAFVLLLAAGQESGPLAGEADKYCMESGRNVVLYLDVSTPYDAIDRTSLIDGVEKIFGSLEGGDRFSIRTIEDAFPSSRRLIDACLPICPSEGFFRDLFSDCTEGVVIEERRKLQKDIVHEIRDVAANSTELPNSEIVRTIAMSAPEEYRANHPNNIFIFSDMIENSQYLPGAQFLSLDNNQIVSDLAKDRLVPNLQDARISVFGVGRKGDATARDALEQAKIEKIVDFWDAFFALAGARMTLQPNLGSVD